jgi:hypothetical protein
VNAPFNENKFYTKAALESEKHIALLKDFEEILRGSGNPLRGIAS